MDRSLQITSITKSVNIIFQYTFIFTIYTKFFLLTVLEQTSIFFDLLLYLSLVGSLNYRKISYFILFAGFISILAFMNPAFKNIFLIILSSYIISKNELCGIIKINLFFQFFIFLICTYFLLFNIIEAKQFAQTLFDTRERWDYGMGNPNIFSSFIFSIITSIYLLFYKHSKIIIILILTIAIATYTYTYSRSFILSCFTLLILYTLRHEISKHITFFKRILLLLPIIMLILIYFLSINYTDYEVIDLILSGRLKLYANMISQLSFADYIIGTPLVNEETIDSSFIHIFFEGGLFVFLLFYIVYYKLIRNINQVILIPYLFSLFSYGITESIMTYILNYGNMIFWIILFGNYRNNTYKNII